MDNVLSYIDQASFMGRRALGRGPVIEWTWVHGHRVHADAVQDFNHRLAQGFLGRLVQRSSVPGGRHRWVANREPAPVTVAPETIPLEQLPQWRGSLVDLAVDPEHGPGWRLAVQHLEESGTALSLLVSHTIADGLGVAQALRDAATGAACAADGAGDAGGADRAGDAGVQPAYGYPSRTSRRSWRNVTRDVRVSAKSLPDVWNAITLLSRRARHLAPGVSSSVARSAPAPSPSPSASGAASRAADVPAVQIVLDEGECASRASALGVSVNTLLAAFTARLGFRLGRVGGDGRVKLVMPVSDRTPGDLRANALRAVTVMADPNECCASPRDLQRAIRSALASLRKHGDDSPILALTPYVPPFLVRKLEGLALGTDFPVGLSNFGELDLVVNRPCGTDAVRMHVSLLERHTPSTLDRIGGKLFLVSYRLSGSIYLDISCWAPSVAASRGDLEAIVTRTLGDIALTGQVR